MYLSERRLQLRRGTDNFHVCPFLIGEFCSLSPTLRGISARAKVTHFPVSRPTQ